MNIVGKLFCLSISLLGVVIAVGICTEVDKIQHMHQMQKEWFEEREKDLQLLREPNPEHKDMQCRRDDGSHETVHWPMDCFKQYQLEHPLRPGEEKSMGNE